VTPSTTSSGASAPEPLDPDPIISLAGRLGHEFADPELLADAVRHRSWCAEHPGFAPNERLEFLGDAVLGLVVAEYMFTLYPDQDEGWLSRARSALVRSSALAHRQCPMRSASTTSVPGRPKWAAKSAGVG